MFAIAFDLDTEDTLRNHPKGVTQAYADRFPPSVRDIRGFRVEQWSDFTGFIKS